MFIVVFPSFFKHPQKPQKTSQHDVSPKKSRQAPREARQAKFRAVLHEHAPFLFGWTLHDSEDINENKYSLDNGIPPPYEQNLEIVDREA